MALALVPPEILKPTRRQRRIAGRVLDIAMPEVRLQRPGIVPSLASLKPQAWRSMWACALIPSLATTAARLTMRLNPGGVSGAPRRRAVALVTAELAQFPAGQGMRCWRAALEPVYVNLAPVTSEARRPWR